MSEENSSAILQQRKLRVARNLFDTIRNPPSGNYDRFIPCRADNNWEKCFATMPDPNKTPQSGKKTNRENGEKIEDVKSQCEDRQALTPVKSRNLFRYGTPTKPLSSYGSHQLISQLMVDVGGSGGRRRGDSRRRRIRWEPDNTQTGYIWSDWSDFLYHRRLFLDPNGNRWV
ncbi:hypothetical protein GWI33_013904 [Rhynchophorus ferrugineus]|uniref:Uncharacterized protein n=1 Tax=Rhynchophorus ferrugineus TaxID=354439 RepID=A0A834MB55_RHYFE|nr:hypothetical protein GWI33_013904 [Rhynchophorus ferrugineus]